MKFKVGDVVKLNIKNELYGKLAEITDLPNLSGVGKYRFQLIDSLEIDIYYCLANESELLPYNSAKIRERLGVK